MKNVEFKIDFLDVVVDTYVVNVSFRDKDFQVNCQTMLNSSYIETNKLSCDNDSGGDFRDSGLAEYLEINGIVNRTDEIKKAIVACAEEYQPENSINRVLSDWYSENICYFSSLFGAFGLPNTKVVRYDSNDYIYVIVDDTRQILAENRIKGVKRFDNISDFKTWEKDMYGQQHYADISVANRAIKDII